jgi:methylenetetrahydrofolate dehydrogenase (NADP+) / methenyltetrahydrofolate cyclohydrolase
MIIFDGYAEAARRERELAPKVAELARQGKKLCIAAVLFTEDQGSVLYTRLKQAAAERVGIEYRVFPFSLGDDVELVVKQVQALNKDQTVTGIIIQKPHRALWLSVCEALRPEEIVSATDFVAWWQTLVTQIEPRKDVDGLHPSTLQAIKDGTYKEQHRVLPATCQAIIDILAVMPEELTQGKYIILGKSDIVGLPLFYYLSNEYKNVEMIGSKELSAKIEDGIALRDADVVVSATGRINLVTGDLIKSGVAVIDVGEPKPDVERQSVELKAQFLTPVPGGVGPMTVVCLLANCVTLGYTTDSY